MKGGRSASYLVDKGRVVLVHYEKEKDKKGFKGEKRGLWASLHREILIEGEI